ADVTQVASAIPCRNVHAAAEGDRQMGVVAADTLALGVGLRCRFRRPGVLVAELDVIVDEVAYGLNTTPPHGRRREAAPRHLEQALGVAVATAEEKLHRLVG